MSDETPPPASNSERTDSPPRERPVRQQDGASRGTVTWVMGLVVAWGIVAALGVLRYDYLHDQLNLTKPLIVIVCTLVVVGGWRLALRRRAARD